MNKENKTMKTQHKQNMYAVSKFFTKTDINGEVEE